MRTLTEAETRRQTDNTDDGRSLSRRRQSVVERIQNPQYPRVLALEFIRYTTLWALHCIRRTARVLLRCTKPLEKTLLVSDKRALARVDPHARVAVARICCKSIQLMRHPAIGGLLYCKRTFYILFFAADIAKFDLGAM